jgi:GR25 family glycosyltransferase involved in LPS biosynthesis
MEGACKKIKDITDLPVYVINMDERKDRWKRFMSNEAIRRFKNLERISAVNGKELKYRTEKRISIGTRLRIFRNYRRSHYEIATLGAIGASISHIKTWQKFYDSGKPCCIIMEDDAVWFPEYIEKINEILPTIPDTCGMWIIGYYPKTLVIEHLSSEKPWNKVHSFTAAHSYIITRETAKKFLEEPFPIETHIEYYMTSVSVIKGVQILQHPDVLVDFYRTYIGPRTNDSNTSQHKKAGCPTCDVADDYSQLYKHYSRKRKDKEMAVSGIVYDKQDDTVLTFKNNSNTAKKPTRKKKRISPHS